MFPLIDHKMRVLCLRGYEGHRLGCPNYGRRAICPPAAPLFDERYDLGRPVYAVIAEYDLAAHVERMREKHPGWSERQLYCCLYWQGGLKKKLRDRVARFLEENDAISGYEATMCPEAMGVNVTATLAAAGIQLEWPPLKVVRKVAFVAGLRSAQ